ncbi:copper chaperone PCu(A)C [Rhodococcus oryzae]|uniref:Copper chaperone PCu(A)C n=1 Tax=Rhodococcus oryzae TaxID=2571143 RepID=A0ABY2RG72_9NOCA|nr:copper chaperone PCu(A)C [Rhodococcus oryzae]TJZ74405.1 copper chaperone PCu(A)C [Rhodococcus oryzae]
MSNNIFSRRRMLAAGAALSLGLALAGCSSDSDNSADEARPAAESVTLTESWVKAADSGMTAAFGTLVNGSGTDATLVAVSSPISPAVEVHEMAMGPDGAMVMQKKEGGVTIPASGTHKLEPGADHIMFLRLPAPVKAGTDVPLTLTFGDGSTSETTVQVRDFTGANESYEGNHG